MFVCVCVCVWFYVIEWQCVYECVFEMVFLTSVVFESWIVSLYDHVLCIVTRVCMCVSVLL